MIATPPLPPAPPEPPGQNGHLPHDETILGGDPLDYISVSRLKSFLSCRLRFYFEKVVAIPRPLSPNLHYGHAIHAGIQHYNKARWRGGDASETAVIAAYQKAFDAPQNGAKVSWESAAEETAQRTEGEPLLRAFLATQLLAPDTKPAGVELKLRAELPSLALPLLGIIDLVTADHVPVDYKTIGKTPDLSLEAWLHELQLTAYTLLVEDATGEKSPANELVFLVKTKTPKVISRRIPAPKQAQRDRFARLVETYATGVANEDYYPSPGMHCGWCDFRSECAAWKGGPA